MAQAIIMPKPGQTMEEATLVKWHKQEGDAIRKGDVLFEIETDKAVLEVESFQEGTLLRILVSEAQTVPVATVVAYVGKPGEAIPAAPPPPVPAAAVPKAEPKAPAPAAALRAQGAAPSPAPAGAPAPVAPPAAGRLLISPRAKALAKASVIDPSLIRGSGPGGRIVEKDVRAHLEASGYSRLRISPSAKQLAAREGLDILRIRGTGASGRIMAADVKRALAERPRPMSKMRQVIARRLTQSFTTTPHFYVSVAADMTSLLAYRKTLKDRGEAYGVTDFILQAVILSLQEFPELNSVCEGATVRWHGSVDLGMAVGLDEGLVVPVLRDAQNLSLRELHSLAETLSARARAGKLLPDEMTGSTFTVSNMGMLGVDSFNAIINPGESGILAVASTVERPVVRDGKIVVRAIMDLTLSVDHRIVDGTKGAAFINAVKSKLEDVDLWKRLT